ncbi:uncharacterized protein LOC110231314 isoform X2 [Exaiptasia diaphana]|uniref:SAM domain-containing protein n=1 Tax=Exaiptasia diaphana TaxID=2652724 RepID=A0A913YB50_EXADI|nr:uncharacterized protein LOC110231314 isoform X2 [Exaiptasia diaphana]
MLKWAYQRTATSGEKIPGVYARPVTRAQKLENLQLCMSFMGNRSINLQGIYVGDLIDGNLNSILSLCGNLKKKFEVSRAGTPDTKRPHSSDSIKQSNRLMNGHVNHNMKDYDGDINKLHGNSSGYHSEEYSPNRVTNGMGLEMPGMMADPHSPSDKVLHPNDVIVSTTKLDRKTAYQSGYELRKNVNLPNSKLYQESDPDIISPSVEERLRSLLNTPNPGGLEEETDDELMIPPPQRRSDLQQDESFDVEERLKSLLDGGVDGFSEDNEEEDEIDYDARRSNALRELDAIGYMPSHPSEKMRNISPTKDRKDSFTGRNKRITKLPTPPALRRVQTARAGSSDRGTAERSRKMSVTKGPAMHITRTTVSSSELPKTQQAGFIGQSNQRTRSDKLNEQSPSDRRSSSHSDFLRQVASRLANEVDTRDTTASSTSISPADTPMLPALSPSSSIASFALSSDSSGTATPVRSYSNKLKVDNRSSRIDDEASTPKRRNRGKAGKNRSANDLDAIKTQLESLESMYADVLCLLDEGVQEGKSKSSDKNAVVNQQKTEELKAGIIAFRKQRSKDIKAVNKRFGRLESHVVTLARSVAHLSSELRSQATVNEDMDELKKEIKRLRTLQEDMNMSKASGAQQSDLYAMNLKRVNKLRKFFGSEPPLLDNFLKKLGYERFAAKFGAEQIGILELPYLNEERLQSLGIPLGPRLRIVEEANRLRF